LQPSELSILIPTQNVEKEIARIIVFAAEQAKGIDAEFIIVDMGSTDKTVLEAVLQIKKLNLRGFVVQNGVSNVPAALNTAIQKANGKYITFFFARRLYRGHLPVYLEIANRLNSDFVFGCITKEELRAAERYAISTVIRRPSGVHYIRELIHKERRIDIAAVLLRRDFILAKQLSFDENCPFGYAEEFLFQVLIFSDSLAQAPALLCREKDLELKRGRTEPVGLKIFSRVEAALRVLDAAKSVCTESELPAQIEKNWIPLVVMDCIDIALRDGINYRSIKDYLFTSGYEKFLVPDRRSDRRLKLRILTWKTAPWLYRV
jgi:glycosyltransferase involved in cell wall biosynthesis